MQAVVTDLSTACGPARERHEAICSLLKQSTRPLHDRLETSLGFPGTFESMSVYGQILLGFFRFYSGFDELLRVHAPNLPPAFNVPRCLRSQFILEDLAALGMQADAASRCDLSFLNSPAHVVGALYVTEGSTLGGCVIHKFMLSRHGDEIRRCTRFLYGHGPRTASQWQSFRNALIGYCDRAPELVSDVIEGAMLTFYAITAELGQLSQSSGERR